MPFDHVELKVLTEGGATVRRKFMTTTGLASALGVGVGTVHHHIRAGHIPTVRDGRRHLIALATARRIIAGYERNRTWPRP